MDIDILSKINRRQRQILVHSCLYYQFNENLIQDHVYDAWSKELVELIQTHKEEFKESVHYTSFKDYDGCSGFDLPFSDPRVVGVAESLLHRGGNRMKFTRKHTYYTLIDTTKDVLIGLDPHLQGQTEVFYTREDAQFGKMEYINECLDTLDEGENIADCKVILQEMVKVLKIRY